MEAGVVFYERGAVRAFMNSVLLIYVFDNLSLRDMQFSVSLY